MSAENVPEVDHVIALYMSSDSVVSIAIIGNISIML